MKILFFLDHIGGGGRERRMAQLVLALNRLPKVQMMTITATPDIDYTEVLTTSMQIKVVSDSSHIERIKKYKEIIKKYKPDIIHLWTETPLFCVFLPVLARRYHSKFIAGYVADGIPIAETPFFQRLCIRFNFRMADAIVSNSKAGLIAKKAPSGKSHVIYNGFDKSRLVDVNLKEKRLELGVTTAKLVTMCARVSYAKDWNLFISLAERCAHLNVFFLAIGGGELLEHYRSEIERKKMSNIRFVGRRADVMEIMTVTDISVLLTNSSGHAEGVSNSIMESMAVGVPVVATDGGGTPEIISNGENGYTVSPGNVEQVYQYVCELLNNEKLCMQIGEKAKNTIYARFDLEKKGQEYISLYEQILDYSHK